MARPVTLHFTDEEKTTILTMYQAGYGIASIHRHLSTECSYGSVRAYLKLTGYWKPRVASEGVRHIICEICDEEITIKGRRKYCPNCIPDKAAAQRYKLYGLTHTQFLAKLEAQHGLCGMCDCDLGDDYSKIHVDHCHDQMTVRDLLCGRCNNALGYIEDDKTMARALRYIERHKR